MYTYHVSFISLQPHIVLYEWWWIVVAGVNGCQRRLWPCAYIEQVGGTALNYQLTKWEQFPYFQQYHKFIYEVGHRTCVYGPRSSSVVGSLSRTCEDMRIWSVGIVRSEFEMLSTIGNHAQIFQTARSWIDL